MQDKIRILYVTDGLGNGGKERQLIETVRHLDRCVYSPGIITFSGCQHYTKTAEDITDFFRILPKEKSVVDPMFTIFECFEKFRPDIVHSFDIISAFYTHLPSRLSRARILNASIQDAGLDKGWQRVLKLFFLKHADVVVSNSFKGLQEYGVEGKVLYNFIEESRFPAPNRKEKFHSAMVANFTVYKDYDAYFRIIGKLLENNLIDDAYAVGSGVNIEKYKALVQNLPPDISDRIVFTGSTGIVEEILSLISVGFLFSTEEYGEGISNSVLEYMASGVIAIVSDIGASREIIENGVNGFLVDKNDTEGIADIVKRIKTDSVFAGTIRENALKTVKEKFSLKRNIKLLEGIYRDLLIE